METNNIELKNCSIKNIKSKYILKRIFVNLTENKMLNMIRYNKIIQKRLDININNYIACFNIECEIFVIENSSGNFINIHKDKKCYQIYFYNNQNDRQLTNRNFINLIDNITKIKVIIDKEIKSFKGLFKDCRVIKKINFIKFNRKDITDMSDMFNGCLSLEELNLSNFKTDNVTDMSYMFNECSSIKRLNLSKFNTNNVTNMNYMFNFCSSLEELNISSFNTNNLITMTSMFRFCKVLKELNLSNFYTKT